MITIEDFEAAWEGLTPSICLVPLAEERVAEVRLTDSPDNDTAFFNLGDGSVEFSRKLAATITQTGLSADAKGQVARSVLQHEGLHAAWTRYWPAFKGASSMMLANHFEDWRINGGGVGMLSGYAKGLQDFSTSVIPLLRPKGAADLPATPTGDRTNEFFAFWDSLWNQALKPKSFLDYYDALSSRMAAPENRELANSIRDHVAEAVTSIPHDPFNVTQVQKASWKWVQCVTAAIKEINRDLNLDELERKSASLSRDELKDLVEQALERRGAGNATPTDSGSSVPGPGQPGSDFGQAVGSENVHSGEQSQGRPTGAGSPERTEGASEVQTEEVLDSSTGTPEQATTNTSGKEAGKDPNHGESGHSDAPDTRRPSPLDPELDELPTEFLRQLKRWLSSPESQVPDGAEVVDGGGADPTQPETGYSDASRQAPGMIEMQLADVEVVARQSRANRPMVLAARRALANALADPEPSHLAPKDSPSRTHGRLSVGSVARRLSDPTSTEPPFVAYEPSSPVQGRERPSYDDFLFAVDGSASMSDCWTKVQTFLSVMREALDQSGTRMVAVFNNGGKTGVLCNGVARTTGRIADLQRIWGSTPQGGSDLAVASLSRLAMFAHRSNGAPERSRLVLVTDCKVGEYSVQQTGRLREVLRMPSALLSFDPEGSFEMVNSVLTSATKKSSTNHFGINVSDVQSPPCFAQTVRTFCAWAQRPASFQGSAQIDPRGNVVRSGGRFGPRLSSPRPPELTGAADQRTR